MALEDNPATLPSAFEAPSPAKHVDGRAIEVRRAVPGDADTLARLSQELLAFYRLPVQFQRSYMTHVIADRAFRDPPSIEILIAFERETAVGFLAFSETFAVANCQTSIFIQDLFVTRKARRTGIGRHLMIALAKICEARGVGQLDWTTDPWNSKAKTFYEELGPLLHSEKIYYRMMAPRIADLAAQDQEAETPA